MISSLKLGTAQEVLTSPPKLFLDLLFGKQIYQHTTELANRAYSLTQRRERSLVVGVVMLCNLASGSVKNKFKLNVQGTSVWYAKANAAPGFLITQTKPEESSYRFVQTKKHTNF